MLSYFISRRNAAIFPVFVLLFCAVSGCNRDSYLFKPTATAYRNSNFVRPTTAKATKIAVVPRDDAASAKPDESVAAATLDATISVATITMAPQSQSVVAKTILPDLTLASKHQQRRNTVKLPLVQHLATNKVLTLVSKKLSARQNTAEIAQPKSLSKRILLQVGGILMMIGLMLFLAALSSYGFEPGITLAVIAIPSFIVGLVLLVRGIFFKD